VLHLFTYFLAPVAVSSFCHFSTQFLNASIVALYRVGHKNRPLYYSALTATALVYMDKMMHHINYCFFSAHIDIKT